MVLTYKKFMYNTRITLGLPLEYEEKTPKITKKFSTSTLHQRRTERAKSLIKIDSVIKGNM